jgi:hypothetical protein
MSERDRLAEALRVVIGGRASRPVPPAHDVPARLASLEREVQEVRTRVNALFFTVLTVALTDVLMRAVLT